MATTAILVLCPEADPLIGEYRARHTPGGRHGMPSHVTVLAPFVDTEQLDDAVEKLEAIARSVGPFDFSLAGTAQFDSGVLYLTVDPSEPFRELTSKVCAAFPHYGPYGGEYTPSELIPHCTVAVADGFPNGPSSKGRNLLDRCESQVQPGLPLAGRATTLVVMADEIEGWMTVAEVELRG